MFFVSLFFSRLVTNLSLAETLTGQSHPLPHTSISHTLNEHGGLSEISPTNLGHLNTWSLVGGCLGEEY